MKKRGRRPVFGFASVLGIVGATLVILSYAAPPANNTIEPETGALTTSLSGASAVVGQDANASNNQYVTFTPPTVTPPSTATLPPGSALPSDATCSSRVVKTPEVRPQNASQNATAGHNKGLSGTYKARVTGAYTGTTDEILQWTACKWGIDPDIVRAQAAKESYWVQANKGDYGTDAANCAPGHGLSVDGTAGQCPESFGILQVRYPYHGPPAGLPSWPEAETSTAYNADYTYAQWRVCYEGELGWLNSVEHTGTYAAGDLWGCVGTWFAGRWKTDPANTYIQEVQDYLSQKIWTTQSFINYR